MDQLHVPANFNWETSKEISLSVAIDLPSGTGALSRIRVYDGDPVNAGKLMDRWIGRLQFPFVTGLRIPTARKQIFLGNDIPEGNSLVSAVNVQDNIQYTFQPSRAGLKNDLNTLDPDCSQRLRCDYLRQRKYKYHRWKDILCDGNFYREHQQLDIRDIRMRMSSIQKSVTAIWPISRARPTAGIERCTHVLENGRKKPGANRSVRSPLSRITPWRAQFTGVGSCQKGR